MSYKPDEKDWMAYLYGELEGEDKEKMDQYLLVNDDARNEFEKFQALRKVMSSVDDKEVIAPPLVLGENRQRFLWNTPYFRVIASIAASLLLILIAGKATDTRISISGNEFRMSFGEVKPQPPVQEKNTEASLTPEQVKQMINESLAQNNAAIESGWAESQQKLNASIRKNLADNSFRIDQLVREASTASQDQVREYVTAIQNRNMQQVRDYFQLTSSEQKKYIEDLLVDFSRYLQQQRNDDLQLVETRLQSLEQNTNIFKQETEQILTSIINTVGTEPAGKETKN